MFPFGFGLLGLAATFVTGAAHPDAVQNISTVILIAAAWILTICKEIKAQGDWQLSRTE